MLPATIDQRLRRETVRNLARYRGAPLTAIEQRLQELDREWDLDRTLQAGGGAVALAGLGLGLLVNRRFFVVTAVACGMLVQHALRGWCLPMPFLRERGYRKPREIEAERRVLRRLRSARLAAEHVHA